MQYSCCKILIACLVLQVTVDATVFVFKPMCSLIGTSKEIVVGFNNQDATIIDAPIQGQLEYAEPSDACGPIAHPVFVKTNESKNLALINGTDKCDFMTKIKNARAAGFEAAILFNPFEEPFNYNIVFPIERSKNITVALVSCEDGIKLRKYTFPESMEENVFIEIAPTGFYRLHVILAIGVPLGSYILYHLFRLFGWGGKKMLKKYRNRVQSRVNVADSDIQVLVSGESDSEASEPNNCSCSTETLKNEFSEVLGSVSGESQSAVSLVFESSASNNCPRSKEKLKNEFSEALGSVTDVQGSELKRENTQAMIV